MVLFGCCGGGAASAVVRLKSEVERFWSIFSDFFDFLLVDLKAKPRLESRSDILKHNKAVKILERSCDFVDNTAAGLLFGHQFSPSSLLKIVKLGQDK